MAAENTDSTPISSLVADINNPTGALSVDGARWRRLEERQTLLWRLLLGALCGLLLQACWVYRLTSLRVSSVDLLELKMAETAALEETKTPQRKPAALLKGSEKKDNVLLWTERGDGFLHEIDYKDGLVTMRQEGFYFLYSKVALSESHCDLVKHTIMQNSQRYSNGKKPIELMQSVRYHCPKPQKGDRQDQQANQDVTSSYLGGAFHLFANDSVYVRLDGQMRAGLKDNFFGAFML